MCTTANGANLLYTDALVYSAECFKYKQSGILNEIIQTSHKEEVIQQNLQWNFDFKNKIYGVN